MKVRYTRNENCYVFTNFADSNNPLFTCEEEVDNFKKRINEHLKEICEILCFNFSNMEYQMLVSLNKRKDFVEFYRKKYENDQIKEQDIPDSTFILSQEMANIQSGYALWFNYRHHRFGSVFGRRYTKILIKTEGELKEWIEKINGSILFWSFSEMWSYVFNFLRQMKNAEKISINSFKLCDVSKSSKDCILESFVRLDQYLLRGSFNNTHFT